MHLATLITILLLAILALAVTLLFTYSYETFIPLGLDFGIYLYLTCLFIIFTLKKYYFRKVVNSPNKKLKYSYLVVLPSIAIFIVSFCILVIFRLEGSNGGGHGGQAIAYIMEYALLLFVALSIWIGFNMINTKIFDEFNNNDKNNLTEFALDNLLKKASVILIPLASILIVYIVFLAYSDFSSGGMKKSFTGESNSFVMGRRSIAEQDIKYCDHIINTYDDSYSINRCYDDFFNHQELKKEWNLIQNDTPHLFSIFFNRVLNQRSPLRLLCSALQR